MNKIKKLIKKPSRLTTLWLVLVVLIVFSWPVIIPKLQANNFFLPRHFTDSVGSFYHEKILQDKETAKPNSTTSDGTDDALVIPSSPTDEQPFTFTNNRSTSQSKTGSSASKPAPTPDAPDIVLETDSSVRYLNSVRAEGGKPALTPNHVMNEWALNHTRAMVAKCSLYHQVMSDFFDRNIGPINVSGMAENVGRAGSIQTVIVGLRNSPGHYHNMMGDYPYVGNGLIQVNSGPCKGSVVTTQLFAR